MPQLSKILLIFFLALCGFAHGQTEKRQKLEKQKIKLLDEIQLANKILSETLKDKETTFAEVQTAGQKLKLRKSLIKTIAREQELLEEDIKELNDEIDSLKVKIKKAQDDYARMIQQARKSSNQYSRLMFILSARDFNQALRRLEYMKQYADFRERQVLEIKEKQDKLRNKSIELSEQLKRKTNLLKQYQQETEQLEKEQESQKEAIAELQTREKEIEGNLKQKQLEAAKVENEIKKVIALEIKKAKERAIRRRIEEEAERLGLVAGSDFTNRTSNSDLKNKIEAKKRELIAAKKSIDTKETPNYELTPEATKLSSNFTANKKRLPWPVDRGLVIVKFGPQRHPIAKSVIINNTGIDIATEKGSDARVVFDGEVSGIMKIKGEGFAVFVMHGDYFTIYRRIGELSVKKGDVLKRGDKIGEIVDMPSEGTRLHFEIWKGTQVLDPLPWLLSK